MMSDEGATRCAIKVGCKQLKSVAAEILMDDLG